MFINLIALFEKLQLECDSKSGGTLQRTFYFVFLLLISLSLGTVLVKEYESHGFKSHTVVLMPTLKVNWTPCSEFFILIIGIITSL